MCISSNMQRVQIHQQAGYPKAQIYTNIIATQLTSFPLPAMPRMLRRCCILYYQGVRPVKYVFMILFALNFKQLNPDISKFNNSMKFVRTPCWKICKQDSLENIVNCYTHNFCHFLPILPSPLEKHNLRVTHSPELKL